jgi:hypothetical protein
MLTFSLAVILLKWTVIGNHKPSATSIWSVDFARWWFIDRLLNVWEVFVGGYLIDTPWLNCFNILLGANIPIFSCRLKTFLREADMVELGKNTEISGLFETRYITIEGLYIDRILVEDNVKLEYGDIVYPGELVTIEERQKCATASAILQIQRLIFPGVLILCITVNSCLLSWAFQMWETRSVLLFSSRIFVVTMGSFIILMVESSILRLAGSTLSYTMDGLGNVAFSFLRHWTNISTLVPIIHRLFFGTNLALDTHMNDLTVIKPSEGRYVIVGSGSAISYSHVLASKDGL